MKYRASLKDEVRRLLSLYDSSCTSLERQIGTPSKHSMYGPQLLRDIKQARRFININNKKTVINQLSIEALECLVNDLTSRVSSMETHISNNDAYKLKTTYTFGRQVGKSRIMYTSNGWVIVEDK